MLLRVLALFAARQFLVAPHRRRRQGVDARQVVRRLPLQSLAAREALGLLAGLLVIARPRQGHGALQQTIAPLVLALQVGGLLPIVGRLAMPAQLAARLGPCPVRP